MHREGASNAKKIAPSDVVEGMRAMRAMRKGRALLYVVEEMRAMRDGIAPSYVDDLRRRKTPSEKRMQAMRRGELHSTS